MITLLDQTTYDNLNAIDSVNLVCLGQIWHQQAGNLLVVETKELWDRVADALITQDNRIQQLEATIEQM